MYTTYLDVVFSLELVHGEWKASRVERKRTPYAVFGNLNPEQQAAVRDAHSSELMEEVTAPSKLA